MQKVTKIYVKNLILAILMVLIPKIPHIRFDIYIHILGHANDPACPAGSGRDYSGKFIANLTWHAKKTTKKELRKWLWQPHDGGTWQILVDIISIIPNGS